MEFFTNVKAVRLRSHLRKYLVAEENEKSIRQSRQGSCRQAKWTVELVEGNSRAIRLKSCYGKYLSATDKDYVLGMTGKRVIQAESKSKFDSSIEWEPSTDGFQMKLKSWSGKYLRANGTALRGAITHDALHEASNNHAHHWLIEKVDELTENNQSFSYECESPTTLSSHSSFSEVDSPKSPWSTMASPKLSSAQ
ncbi:hypothetical protein MKW92_007486, partial [Papaver armeniacum]